jgi:hypothetical protein
MSISPENTNPRRHLLTEAEVDAIYKKCEQLTGETECPTESLNLDGAAEPRRPTNIREAACKPWVIVPPQFNASAKLSPNDVVQVQFYPEDGHGVWFYVHESVVMDSTLEDAFLNQVLDEFPELFPNSNVSFGDVDLNDDLESFAAIGVYQIDEMKAMYSEMKPRKFLVEGYIPAESLILSVGDSNIGKTPAQYQLGICIAAGMPFFDIPVTRGRVLYLDFENTIDDAMAKPDDISKHLGLSAAPKYFKMWHPAMAKEGYDEHIWDIVRKTSPTLVIIDTLAASFPRAEKGNTEAAEFLNEARKITREVGCAIMFTHHLTKSSGRNDVASGATADPTIQELMKDVRGASALVNGVDVRLMFRKPRSSDGSCAFELQGFRRMHGTLPTIAVERVFDENSGEAIGYTRLAGVGLIKNPRYREIFPKLQHEFQWKDLKENGLGGGSCRHCIDDYRSAGVLEPTDEGKPFRKKDGIK